jgi:hypothetical protein
MTLSKLYGTGLLAVVLAIFVAGCRSGNDTAQRTDAADTTPPTVTSASVGEHERNVAINRPITATFSKSMDSSTINSSTFTVTEGNNDRVPGDVTCTGTVATFTPRANLKSGKTYTVRVAKHVRDRAGNPMAQDAMWTFETGSTAAKGPTGIALGNASNYAILAQVMISTTGETSVRGDIGLSPGDGSRITGFSNRLDGSKEYSTSSLVHGRVYAADYSSQSSRSLGHAIEDMHAAYSDANTRKNPDSNNLGRGALDRVTLEPGLHSWTGDVTVSNGITFKGGPNDVWIMQIGRELIVNNGVIVTLSGGAQAKNIFWQVPGQVILGTDTEFKGIILSKDQITLRRGATLIGRAMTQTSVTLDAATVTAP